MWPHRSHIMASFTSQTGAFRKSEFKTFEWTNEMQDAFDKTRTLIATDTMSAYPNHNKSFHIYTDASDYQLGAVIMQDGHPVTFTTHVS